MPIWEARPGRSHSRFGAEQHSNVGGPTLLRAFQGLAVGANSSGGIQDASALFQLASQNATIEDIFGCAQVLYPGLCALTVEGGHCKRPPKVQYFRGDVEDRPSRKIQAKACETPTPTGQKNDESNLNSINQSMLELPQISPPLGAAYSSTPSPSSPCSVQSLPTLPHTKTLILKGAWNIVRSPADFAVLVSALPSLREFHCTYHKPKTMAYATMYESLALNFSSTITHLNLCLEGLYTKNASSLKKWRKLYPMRHICRSLGAMTPRLESLTYTGRVCGTLFHAAQFAAEAARQHCPKLKAIDIVVNNVCRDPKTHNDSTGIYNWAFIQLFESLVIHAVRSLQVYTIVRTMRIRFIDLDSPAPLLNPMFHLEGDRAWGIYSDEICKALTQSRPKVQWGNLPGEYGYDAPLGSPDQAVHQCHLRGDHRVVSVAYYKAMARAGGLI